MKAILAFVVAIVLIALDNLACGLPDYSWQMQAVVWLLVLGQTAVIGHEIAVG